MNKKLSANEAAFTPQQHKTFAGALEASLVCRHPTLHHHLQTGPPLQTERTLNRGNRLRSKDLKPSCKGVRSHY